MKTFLANAFAVGRLAAIQEFHLSRRSTNAPVSPSQSLPRVPKTNAIEPGSYSIIPCSAVRARRACFEHSNFFKVNVSAAPGTQSREPGGDREEGQAGSGAPCGGPPACAQDPTTSFLTAAILIYAIGAGITAAAGTRLALQ